MNIFNNTLRLLGKNRRNIREDREINIFTMYGQHQNGIRPRRPVHLNDNGLMGLNDFKNNENNRSIKNVKTANDFIEPFNSDNVSKTAKSKRYYIKKYASKEFATFCDKTSLHGLKYIGDPTITYFERFFWLTAFILAVGFATYFILLIYEKYDNSPVIVSFNPVAVPVNTIPFPSVTICNLNQATKSHADFIQKHGSELDKKLLDDFCNLNAYEPNSSYTEDETTTWNYMKKFIINVSQPCSEIFKACMWKQAAIDCNKYIQTHFTDDGLCCTFNRLPAHLIMKNRKTKSLEIIDQYLPKVKANGLGHILSSIFELASKDLTFRYLVAQSLTYFEDKEEGDFQNISTIDWSPKRGYNFDDPISFLPWRQEGPGSHLGLTVVVNASVDDFFCSSSYSIGFKIIMMNPIDTPKIADYGFLANPGIESRIVIVPSIIEATETLNDIDVEKRQCFFPDERTLKYYRIYTQRHCELECQSNFTLQQCGCIPYYLPKEANATICGKKKEACVEGAKEVMSSLSSMDSLRVSCNCLASCFDISFTKEVTYGSLKADSVPQYLLANTTAQEFLKNVAILRFYYNQGSFRKQTKSELFGFSEFLSNTGGLLGLFLGFSFLSAVEIGYYLSLRIVCNWLHSSRKARKQHISPKEAIYPYCE